MKEFTQIFQELGLAKNEARIYETLLRYGESPVGRISEKSGVHRRNVYDSLNRLIEKGLVFEILERNENTYQAVDPHKLSDLLQEKADVLSTVMPDLEKLYGGVSHENEIQMYKGVEGWKNIFRDIVRQKSDVYIIGSKAGLASESLNQYAPQFLRETKKAATKFHVLYDFSVMKNPESIGHLGNDYKILPEKYSNPATIAIWGDRMAVLPAAIPQERYDRNFSIVVFINQQTADAFRLWFQFMWDSCPTPGKSAPPNSNRVQTDKKLV